VLRLSLCVASLYRCPIDFASSPSCSFPGTYGRVRRSRAALCRPVPSKHNAPRSKLLRSLSRRISGRESILPSVALPVSARNTLASVPAPLKSLVCTVITYLHHRRTAMRKLRIVTAKVWHGATETGP
jgi:hypothetical protein